MRAEFAAQSQAEIWTSNISSLAAYPAPERPMGTKELV